MFAYGAAQDLTSTNRQLQKLWTSTVSNFNIATVQTNSYSMKNANSLIMNFKFMWNRDPYKVINISCGKHKKLHLSSDEAQDRVQLGAVVIGPQFHIFRLFVVTAKIMRV